jgi:hypothetical protein
MDAMIVIVPLFLVLLGYAVVIKQRAVSVAIGDLRYLLRHVDLGALETLFDPATELQLRMEMSSRALRAVQIARLVSAQEQVSRLAHNAAIWQRWANNEHKKIAHKNPSVLSADERYIADVIRSAARVRRQAFAVTVKIICWRTLFSRLRWSPIPRLCDLRESLGVDLLDCYQGLVTAAGQLGLANGREAYEAVLAAM